MNKRIRPMVVLLGLLFCVPLAAQGPTGWRQDGTGAFPKANPPREWSKEKNVLWKTRLPGSSYGTPLVVGDRLFVVSDPAELLCIRASDGKILWRQTNTTGEVYGQAKAKEIAEEYAQLEKERNARSREENKLRKEQPDEKEALAKLRQKVRDAEQAIKALSKKVPRKERGGAPGNTAATPVCDGKHVAAVFGTGIVGAYTTEGKRLWLKFIETPEIGFGLSSSPVLVGDKLIVHLRDLIALDVKTGKEFWRLPLSGSHASSVITRLHDEDVLITPAGALVRAEDGKVLLKGKFHASENTPLLRDGVLYVSRPGTIQAFKLSRNDDGIALEEVWKVNAASGRRTPSSVIHDGLYGANTSGMLEVNDLKTGELVYRQRLPFNQVYSSVTLAGESLYLLDTRGKALVFKPGRRFERVATDEPEGTGACPVFVGDRMYLRGQQHLYCLAARTEKTRSDAK